MCAQPSRHAIQLYNRMNSLPNIATETVLLTCIGTNCRRETLIEELQNYRNQCVPNLRDRIQTVIDSVECIDSGGCSQMYTFAFSSGGRSIEFIDIAVRPSRRPGMLDFHKYTYTYESSSHNEWNAINNETRDLLEACFIYELVGLGVARITNGKLVSIE